jgi:alpha-tubulin suppressor-like RCC1 family protein
MRVRPPIPAAFALLLACSDEPAWSRGRDPAASAPDAAALDEVRTDGGPAEGAPGRDAAAEPPAGPTPDAGGPLPRCEGASPGCALTGVLAGADSSCVLRADGELRCWGAAGDGRAPYLTLSRAGARAAAASAAGPGACFVSEASELWCSARGKPARVGTGARFRAIDASAGRACALLEGGGLSCFALDADGVPLTPQRGGLLAGSEGRFRAVSVGPEHACALDEAGALYCWGSEAYGRMGSAGDHAAPSLLAAGPFSAVGVGLTRTCVLDAAGAVACWGGEGGSTSLPAPKPPTPVALPSAARSIDVGADHACALLSDGRVACWGEGADGQLGQGALEPSASPVIAVGVTGARAIATGDYHSCALSDEGVQCWGSNLGGAVAPEQRGRASALVTPRARVSRERYVDVAVGARQVCAIDTEQALRCWGEGSPEALPVPAAARAHGGLVSPPGGWTRVRSGSGLGCALRNAGELWCWGFGGAGVLGADWQPEAAQLLHAGLHFGAFAVGAASVCAISDADALWCWGSDQNGELGSGRSGAASPSARPVLAGVAMRALALGDHAAAAIDARGRLFAWGRIAGAISPPSELLPGVSFAEVAAGSDHLCALSSAGELYCVGLAPKALGRAVPQLTKLGDERGYRELVARGHTTCARAAAGGHVCFGSASPGGASATTRPLAGVSLTRLSVGPLDAACGLDADSALRCLGSPLELAVPRFGYEHPLPVRVALAP